MAEHDLISNEMDIQTAEGVRLPLIPAGVGARGLAFVLDLFFQGIILSVAGVLSAFMGLAGDGLYLIVLFFVWWFYGVFFDMLFNGQTLGKMIVGVRTIRENGSPITLNASIVRNLLYTADFLPFLWIGGITSMILTKNSQRLGDIVGGTMVIYDRQVKRAKIEAGQNPAYLSVPLTARDQQALLSYAERFEQLSPERREELAQILAPYIQNTDQSAAEQLRDLGARIGGQS